MGSKLYFKQGHQLVALGFLLKHVLEKTGTQLGAQHAMQPIDSFASFGLTLHFTASKRLACMEPKDSDKKQPQHLEPPPNKNNN